MIASAALAALLVLQTAQAGLDRSPGDTGRKGSISMGLRGERETRKPIALTPELLASAYRDPAARSLIERARAARSTQDSLLQSYDATSTQRISIGARLKAIGRERLVWRMETARRIQWQRGIGAHVEVLGARQVVPVVSSAVTPVRDYP